MANRRFIDFPIASTVGDNDIVLIWQDGANKQTTKATILSGLPENLDELNDVVISGLTNGQILRYDSVTGKWVNTDQGNLDLNDLNDVSIVSPTNGQVLVYNSSTGKWENSSGGYVPYTGAVTTVNLGAQGLRAGYVRFDTSVASVPNEQGLMYWDASRSTAALIMNGTLQHIGQDTFFYVKNSSGSTIPKGTCVRFAGTDGASGHLLVTPFLANGSVPSTYFMGVTAEAITNGSFGQVMHFGELEGINTSGFTAGALLYASTTVAGGFQTTVPVAPNNIVLVAAAVNSKNNGAIVVRPTYGSNINIDEGVKITSPTTGDLLQLQAGGLWENKTLAQVIGSAYVPSTRTLTINGTAFDLSANRSWTVGDVRTDVSYSNPSWITALAWSKITGTPTTLSGYGITDAYTETEVDSLLAGYVTLNTFQNISGSKIFGTNRLIMDGEGTAQPTSLSNTQQSNSALASHNSIGFNGSNNIYFNKGTTANGGIFAFSNSATRTYTLKDASGTLAFTSDIPANPVGGTGTTNFLPKFTGTSTIGNSQIIDNTNVLINRTFSYNAGTFTGQKLQVTGGIGINTDSADGVSRLTLLGSSSTGDGTIDWGGNGNFNLVFSNNGNTRMTLNSTGNLLVGTTTDNGARLQVSGVSRFNAGTSSDFAIVIDSNSNFAFGSTNGRRTGTITRNSGDKPGLQFGYDATDNTGILAGATESLGAGIDFYTYNGSSWGNRLRIASTGAATFSSSVTAANFAVGAASNFNAMFYTVGAVASYIQLANGSTGANSANGMLLGVDGSGNGIVNVRGAVDYITSVAGLERFRITSSGNVGIGTPSPLAFGGLTTLSINGNVGALGLMNNGSNVFLLYNDGSNTLLNSVSNTGLVFGTNNTERMRITAGGNVLIGTTTDNGARLQVNGNATATRLLLGTSTATSYRMSIVANSDFDTAGILLQDTNTGGRVYTIGSSITTIGNLEIVDGTAGTLRFSINSSGNARFTSLGTGTVYSNGGTLTNTNPSDFNLKENIAPINYGLGEILQLNPVTFNWKNDTINQGKQYGFIAQEVQKIMPDLVKKGEYLGLDKEAIFTTLVKAIQELKQEINTLKN